MPLHQLNDSDIFNLLHYPNALEWTMQGLGMLRAYLDDDHIHRLHIWDTERATHEVSTIHDHPWDFESHIISGDIANVRFYPMIGDDEFWSSQLVCGEGGGLLGKPKQIGLRAHAREFLKTGDTYSQRAEELHESIPSRGAVTIITREFRDNRDVATVCWRAGYSWVSAEPRPATPEEIRHFTTLAIQNWNAKKGVL